VAAETISALCQKNKLPARAARKYAAVALKHATHTRDKAHDARARENTLARGGRNPAPAQVSHRGDQRALAKSARGSRAGL
jgi:hypothetical protein